MSTHLIDTTEKAHQVARHLFACAHKASASEDKRASLIALPDLVWQQAHAITQHRYRPGRFTIFAVNDPKLREILAPPFKDRLVQHWLVDHIEPWWDRRFIGDSFANRRGKGTLAAINRLQRFMRQPGHRWYLQLDIEAFFPSIDRALLLAIWQRDMPKMHLEPTRRAQLDHVVHAILKQDPKNPPPIPSGDLTLLRRVPPHKTLMGAPAGKGLPIGSLSSQFFANVYLNELDQFVKHQLHAKAYIRYVDDFVLLADSPGQLMQWRQAIETFLKTQLDLRLHPRKQVLQRCNQGIDFLGNVTFPTHRYARQRIVKALRRRLRSFEALIDADESASSSRSLTGGWERWLARHQACTGPGLPTTALLQRMLSTINSYYGTLKHANTYHLRRHIYHEELGHLRKFFRPDGPGYQHLRIRKAWLVPT